MIISMELAHEIWNAHREIKVGHELLAQIDKALKEGTDPNPLDPFGRRKPFTMGVPYADGHKMLNLSPKLARAVIVADIATKERDLVEACARARLELEMETEFPDVDGP